MLIENIFKTVEDSKECEWESEASQYYWTVEYDIENHKVNIYFVEEYHYDSDEWGELNSKTYKEKINSFYDVSEKDYINLLISILTNRIELDVLYGPQMFDKISFARV